MFSVKEFRYVAQNKMWLLKQCCAFLPPPLPSSHSCCKTAIQTTVNLLRLSSPPLHKEARQKRKELRRKLQAEQEELERQMKELQVANETKQKELETVREVDIGVRPFSLSYGILEHAVKLLFTDCTLRHSVLHDCHKIQLCPKII